LVDFGPLSIRLFEATNEIASYCWAVGDVAELQMSFAADWV